MWSKTRKTLGETKIIDRRYELDRLVARTKFSEVWHGRQLSTGQEVVVKVPLLEGSLDEGSETTHKHLLRELSVCSKVKHPNVVRLLDGGELGGRGIYLVFEYIEGETLASLLRREKKLEPFEARRLMLQCLDALSCGHGHGIVHRDFKPSNVMITTFGSQRNALVMDFGLAASTTLSDADDETWWSTADALEGTVAYMAPEQFDGHVTAQSDIYAWGLVYLECLTGARVHSADSLKRVRRMKCERVPIPQKLRAHPLGNILTKATTGDLWDRYRSSAQLLSTLRACPMRGVEVKGLSRVSDPTLGETLPASLLKEVDERNLEPPPPPPSSVDTPIVRSSDMPVPPPAPVDTGPVSTPEHEPLEEVAAHVPRELGTATTDPNIDAESHDIGTQHTEVEHPLDDFPELDVIIENVEFPEFTALADGELDEPASEAEAPPEPEAQALSAPKPRAEEAFEPSRDDEVPETVDLPLPPKAVSAFEALEARVQAMAGRPQPKAPAIPVGIPVGVPLREG